MEGDALAGKGILGKASGRFSHSLSSTHHAQHPQRAPVSSVFFVFPSSIVPYQTATIIKRSYPIIEPSEQYIAPIPRHLYVSTSWVVFSTNFRVVGTPSRICLPPHPDSARHFFRNSTTAITSQSVSLIVSLQQLSPII